MLSRLNSKVKSEFEPSMKIVSRILDILLEDSSIGRTELSQLANLHYSRLSKYLKWLKNKSLIEFVAADEKIVIKLTHNGKNFTIMMSEENQ